MKASKISETILAYCSGATDRVADGVLYKELAAKLEELTEAEKTIKTIILDSDCTCWGDQNGFATNPQCIIHGNKR